MHALNNECALISEMCLIMRKYDNYNTYTYTSCYIILFVGSCLTYGQANLNIFSYPFFIKPTVTYLVLYSSALIK